MAEVAMLVLLVAAPTDAIAEKARATRTVPVVVLIAAVRLLGIALLVFGLVASCTRATSRTRGWSPREP